MAFENAIERIGSHALFTGKDDFPALQDMAEDAPPVLIALRDPVHLGQPNIAIVGQRNASANERGFAGTLAAELVAAENVFVSEMARSNDTSAYIDALPFGTAAILAGGVRGIYPREDVDLQANIIECGTAVSEIPFGVTPQGRHCPRPNRIISSHSGAVASVEAAERSGSLSATRFAEDQGG